MDVIIHPPVSIVCKLDSFFAISKIENQANFIFKAKQVYLTNSSFLSMYNGLTFFDNLSFCNTYEVPYNNPNIRFVSQKVVLDALSKLKDGEKLVKLAAQILQIPIDKLDSFHSLNDEEAFKTLIALRNYDLPKAVKLFKEKTGKTNLESARMVLQSRSDYRNGFYDSSKLKIAKQFLSQSETYKVITELNILDLIFTAGKEETFWTFFFSSSASLTQKRNLLLTKYNYDCDEQQILKGILESGLAKDLLAAFLENSNPFQTFKLFFTNNRGFFADFARIFQQQEVGLSKQQKVDLICQFGDLQQLKLIPGNLASLVCQSGISPKKQIECLVELGYDRRQIAEELQQEEQVFDKQIRVLNLLVLVEMKQELDDLEARVKGGVSKVVGTLKSAGQIKW